MMYFGNLPSGAIFKRGESTFQKLQGRIAVCLISSHDFDNLNEETEFGDSVVCEVVPFEFELIGIYDPTSVLPNTPLERCSKDNLKDALNQWRELGFNPTLGPAYRNLIHLS